MNETMHHGPVIARDDRFSYPPSYASIKDDRLDRKQKLVASLRLFGKFGFDDGVAGHVTVRDPEHNDRFWVNPFGISFKLIKVSDLIQVNHDGEVLAGDGPLNQAAFAIHSQIHKYLPQVTAVAHTHSLYGKTWSTLGRLLDPLTQDACAFYRDHTLFADFTGVVLDPSEGMRIAQALANNKAAILQNHGLLTAGASIDETAWWFISMERCCQSQLLAEAAGTPKLISPDVAEFTHDSNGSGMAGWLNFQPLYDQICADQPDLFD